MDVREPERQITLRNATPVILSPTSNKVPRIKIERKSVREDED
jgi:hypothetical protein